METQLTGVHLKWKKLRIEIDMREMSAVINKRKKRARDEDEGGPQERSFARVFGGGGFIDKYTRKVWREGQYNLKTDGFKTQEDKKEFMAWVAQLDVYDKKLVALDEWE